jgi:hypothetical protein
MTQMSIKLWKDGQTGLSIHRPLALREMKYWFLVQHEWISK